MNVDRFRRIEQAAHEIDRELSRESTEKERIEAAMRSTGLGVSDMQVDATIAEVERIVRERVSAAITQAAARLDALADEYRDDDAGFHYQDAAETLRSLRFPPGSGLDQ